MEITSIEYAKYDEKQIPAMGKKLDSIFQNNPDINKTSYLNWRIGCGELSRSQFVVMGKAFFSTAYNLLMQCLLNNKDKKADLWIFPILFNTVHGIEIYLKAINALLSGILEKPRGITEGGHDIRLLCSSAKKLLIEYKGLNSNNTTEQMVQGINIIENFIANIYEKTDDMTFARYPLSKNKKGHFYIETLENEVVDLELFANQIVYLYHMLDFIFIMPELDLEFHAENIAEMYD